MVKRNQRLDWDELLDGRVHTLNLDEIGWERGLNDLRAKVHYEADKRRGVAHTHKVDAVTLQFHVVGARPVVRPTVNCTCGGGAKGPHVITCRAVKDWPTPLLDEDHPDFVPLLPDPEAEDLGPCTCGQSPQCLPDCARWQPRT